VCRELPDCTVLETVSERAAQHKPNIDFSSDQIKKDKRGHAKYIHGTPALIGFRSSACFADVDC
jgi:hypothetical protein